MHRSGIGIRPDTHAAHLGLTSPDYTPACMSNQLPKTNRPRCWKVFLLQSCMMVKERKKTLRSSQDSNLGPLNSGQMLLPTSEPKGWHKHFSSEGEMFLVGPYKWGFWQHIQSSCCYYLVRWWQHKVLLVLIMQSSPSLREIQPENQTVCMYG